MRFRSANCVSILLRMLRDAFSSTDQFSISRLAATCRVSLRPKRSYVRPIMAVAAPTSA